MSGRFNRWLLVILIASAFVISDGARPVFTADPVFSNLAHADKDKDDDDDDGKDKDKDKDGDDCDLNDWIDDQSQCSWTFSCFSLDKLQINYDKKFIAGSPTGPNIKVTGVDSTNCTVDIKKISGDDDCAFKVKTSDNKLKIDTKRTSHQNDCALTIETTIPRTMSISGDSEGSDDDDDDDKDKDDH